MSDILHFELCSIQFEILSEDLTEDEEVRKRYLGEKFTLE